MKRSLQIGKNRGFSEGSRPNVNSGQNTAFDFHTFFETSAAKTAKRSPTAAFSKKIGQNSRFLPVAVSLKTRPDFLISDRQKELRTNVHIKSQLISGQY
ncbi:MAG: hypothetical protein ACKON9_22565, partial [Planctomycetaceae bacterium]